MRDIPIIFSGPMVRALLDGRKTMTRRLAWRLADVGDNHTCLPTPWQRVKPGDRLWVRETWARTSIAPIISTIDNPWVVYRECDNRCDYGGPWRSPIHLARRDSRITLIVTATKTEPLEDISEADARAEGCPTDWRGGEIQWFQDLWCGLHGEASWDANPEVVAITFTAHKSNIDALPKVEAA